MGALIFATFKIIGVLCIACFAIAATAVTSWGLIYHCWGCRRNPIGKTAVATIAVLWCVSAVIINFM